MEVGQTAQTTIYARVPWNDTKIDLVEGGLYRFTADGTW
ncbi:putative site-specific integrase-resolvase [Pseudomonas frederiksbergensis]